MLLPYVSRNVLYHENGIERAAIITLARPDKTVNLVVFRPDGETFNVFAIAYGENHNEWSETEGDRVLAQINHQLAQR